MATYLIITANIPGWFFHSGNTLVNEAVGDLLHKPKHPLKQKRKDDLLDVKYHTVNIDLTGN